MSTRASQSTSMNIAGKILWMAIITAVLGLGLLTLGIIQTHGLGVGLIAGTVMLASGTVGRML